VGVDGSSRRRGFVRPCSSGGVDVRSETCAGSVHDDGETAVSKRTPSRAIWSITGLVSRA
jgi:hypothetical protein